MRRRFAALHLHLRALAARASYSDEHSQHRRHMRRVLATRRRLLLKVGIAFGACFAIAILGIAALWLRLLSGPLPLDAVTPWLTSAIVERLGGNYRIDVGGTQLERDEHGLTALRLRDIVLRDKEGAVVATAPKAEVSLDAAGLLVGRFTAKHLNLIGAEMAVRIKRDGQVTVFAGADQKPLATTRIEPAPTTTPNSPAGKSALPIPPGARIMAALLAWIDSIDALGLEKGGLTEIGLRNGKLTVDDERNAKRWSFRNINISLTQPKEGGIALSISSSGADGPWSMTATVSPRGDGRRSIEAVVRDISPRDLLLALRVGSEGIRPGFPLSAKVRIDLAADGTVQLAGGTIVVGAGVLFQSDDKRTRVQIDEARVDLRWVAAARQLVIPIEVLSGKDRLALVAEVELPSEPNGSWNFGISRGRLMLTGVAREAPLEFDRISLRGRYNPATRRLEFERGEVGGVAASIALSGSIDFSTDDPRVALGVAGTRMPVATLKRMWPFFVNPEVRQWVFDHVDKGMVERMLIATNAPYSTMKNGGPPMPADGLFVDIATSGTTLRPVDDLPAIRDADVVTSVAGRKVHVRLGRGVADLPSGRTLTVTQGEFEVPDSYIKPPPSRVAFHLDGPADATAELLALKPLRGAYGVTLDPATTHGTVAAKISIAVPLQPNPPKDAWKYAIDAKVTNFSADKLVRDYKAEADVLHINATAHGFLVKGDAKLAGTPVSLEYRKSKPDADPEIRLAATLDSAARQKLGFDFSSAVTGPVKLKLSGKVVPPGHEPRFSIEADLTHAQITDLLPGWNKPAGKPAHANFTVIDKTKSIRFEDLVIEGSGASVKGTVEVSREGDVISAKFPSFALSDGDKASLKAEQTADGVLRVTIRGEVYDARGFVRSQLANVPRQEQLQKVDRDISIDVKLGAAVGFNGEAMRSVELRMVRKNNQVREFVLTAKLGRDATLIGDLRRTASRQVIYLEASDAGALFRFTDTYPRMFGGQLWVAMDPPTGGRAPQDGILNIRNFAIRNEPALEQVAGGAQNATTPGHGVAFDRLRVEFTRSPGKLHIRDGVVKGQMIGATIDGTIDYSRNSVRMRGTFVPFYGLNNVFGNIPIVGPIIGGGTNEGLLGLTYEVAGPPNAPILRVNPVSAMMPGVFRKIFEFRGADDQINTQTR